MKEFLYGQINENNVLIGKSALSDKVKNPNMIVITADEYENLPVGSIFDRDKNSFKDPPPLSELEVLQAQLEQVEAKLRQEFDNYKFFAWLEALGGIPSVKNENNIDENNITEINIFSQDYKTITDHEIAIKQLVKQRRDILQKLEVLKNSEIKTFS